MDDKILDNIFKTAFNSKSKISQEEGDWDDFELKLKKRLNKRSFFFYTWNRFNIYYVGIILACLVSGGLIYSQNYLWNSPKNNNEKNNTLPIDSSSIRSGRSEDEKVLPITKDVKTTGINKINRQNKLLQENTSPDINLTRDSASRSITGDIIKDTIFSTKEPTNTPPVVIMKRKKTVMLTTPQDTVVKIDTIKVKKGRKK